MATAELIADPKTNGATSADERVAEILRRIVRLTRLSTHAIEADTGVSGAQRFVLEQLDQGPAHSMRELADRTMTDISSVSAVVRRLEERGMVEREPSAAGGRRVTLRLTEAGRTALQRLAPTAQARMLQGLQRLSEDERETLAEHLERWMEATQAAATQAA